MGRTTIGCSRPALGVAADGAQRQEHGQDGPEEEGHEHREPDERRADEGLLLEVGHRAERLRLLERLAHAEPEEREERDGEHDDDGQDPAAQRLAQRVAGDGAEVGRHVPSTASRYASSSVPRTTRTP